MASSRRTSAAAATPEHPDEAPGPWREQVLDAQVDAGEQRHRQAQPGSAPEAPVRSSPKTAPAAGGRRPRRSGPSARSPPRSAPACEQDRAGVVAAAARRAASGSRYMPEADRDPDDRLRRHGGDRVRAGGVAVASCLTTITCTSCSANRSVRPATGTHAPASRSRRRWPAVPDAWAGAAQRDRQHQSHRHERERAAEEGAGHVQAGRHEQQREGEPRASPRHDAAARAACSAGSPEAPRARPRGASTASRVTGTAAAAHSSSTLMIGSEHGAQRDRQRAQRPRWPTASRAQPAAHAGARRGPSSAASEAHLAGHGDLERRARDHQDDERGHERRQGAVVGRAEQRGRTRP